MRATRDGIVFSRNDIVQPAAVVEARVCGALLAMIVLRKASGKAIHCMVMKWRRANLDDSPVLARMNVELIQDEGHSNPMTAAQLEDRMRRWLAAEYSAVLFEDAGEPVANALFRDNEGRGIFLRQFLVVRHLRRQGMGRRAIELLANEVVPGTRIVVDVLVWNERALAFWRNLGFSDYAHTLERRSTTP